MPKEKTLDDIVQEDFFSSSDDPSGELESAIRGIERHGYPAEMRQSAMLAYAKAMCPTSRAITMIERDFHIARHNAISAEWVDKVVASHSMADKVIGKIPLSRAFGGADKR